MPETDIEYVPIRVSTLRGDQKVPFKVYLRVGSRYILYVRQGDSFEGARLKKIKEKRLKKMFILPDDESHYRGYISKNIEMAYDKSSGMAIESRAEIVQGDQQNKAEDLMENVEDEKTYADTKENASKYVDFLMQESDAIKSILNVENSDNSVAHHGVTVSTYAVALAQELGIQDANIKLLALGCLVHDIEQHLRNNRPTKKIADMSPDELQIYQAHPMTGARNIKDLQHMDPVVTNIILQHEECIDGSGFPQQLQEKNIDPLALIAGIANATDRIAMHEKCSPSEAGKKVLIDCMGKYPLEHLQMMQKITKEFG